MIALRTSLLLAAIALTPACNSKRRDEPAPPTATAAKPVAEQPAPAKPAEPEPEPALADDEAWIEAKMNDNGAEEREATKDEYFAEQKRRADAPQAVAAMATLATIADGSFDPGTSIDPGSTLGYLDYASGKLVQRELCGGKDAKALAALTTELAGLQARLTKQLGLGMVHCAPMSNERGRCDVEGSPDHGTPLTFVFEIVMGEAQLRAFSKGDVPISKEAQMLREYEIRDAALLKLGGTSCADAHGT